MSVIVKGGGGKKSGAYVWKKYEYDEKYFDAPVSFVIAGTSGSNFLINVSSDKLDLSSVDATFFEGYTVAFMSGGNTIDCAFEANGVVKVIVHSSGSTQSLTYSYNATSQQITVYDTNIGTDWIASPALKSGKEALYLTNVVSDNPTAYPDGGEQGGYWYEKVVEGIPIPAGITKFAVDKFTFSSDIMMYNHNLAHSLGEAPKFAIAITSKIAKGSSYNGLIIGSLVKKDSLISGACTYYTGSTIKGSGLTAGNPVMDATNVRFHESGIVYVAGVEYTLITMS